MWSKSGEILEFLDVKESEYSTIKMYQNTDQHSIKRKNSKIINVETISLFDLLKFHNAPEIIDYMSVDTEGSELEILLNFPFEHFKFNLISIEHNYGPSRQKLRKLLQKNGYKPFLEDLSKWDDWFVPI